VCTSSGQLSLSRLGPNECLGRTRGSAARHPRSISRDGKALGVSQVSTGVNLTGLGWVKFSSIRPCPVLIGCCSTRSFPTSNCSATLQFLTSRVWTGVSDLTSCNAFLSVPAHGARSNDFSFCNLLLRSKEESKTRGAAGDSVPAVFVNGQGVGTTGGSLTSPRQGQRFGQVPMACLTDYWTSSWDACTAPPKF